jgi:hypothetical protein
MEEDAVAVDSMLLEHADVDESFEMHRSTLALGDAGIDDVADATIGLAEDHIEQERRR